MHSKYGFSITKNLPDLNLLAIV